MEVAGQEILTRDKVSLRVNLTALWQIEDVVRARASVTEVADSVYKTLQFALRAAVGVRSLDESLADKSVLDREIRDAAVAGLEVQGVAVRSVGVKDVILPGEMKTILNQVVEAEKRAQANLIQRREEAAAMRSLLNAASQENETSMEGNTTLQSAEGAGDAGDRHVEDRQADGVRRTRRCPEGRRAYPRAGVNDERRRGNGEVPVGQWGSAGRSRAPGFLWTKALVIAPWSSLSMQGCAADFAAC